jgi:CRP-like cAMP-binding protein/Fe-S-cluster-containing hydrogenase component 2/ferredoxin
VFIDGRSVRVPRGTTIFEAAQSIGINIPTICHMPPQTPAGVCRVCVVEQKQKPPKPGEKAPPPKLVPACAQQVSDKMEIETSTHPVTAARRTLVELLMADHPSPCARQEETHDCELEQRAKEFGANPARFAKAVHEKAPFAGWTLDDTSHPNILVDHAACILCDRCVRGCTDQAGNFVIGRAGKGSSTVITFDDGHRMGESSCVSCGECMASCPTGALMNRGFRSAGLTGTPVTADQLLKMSVPKRAANTSPIPLFEGISHKYLTKVLGDVGVGRNEHAVVERRIPKGQDICVMGEEGSTAFFVVSGKVKVAIPPPRKVESVASRLSRFLRGMRQTESPDTDARRLIPVDASIDLKPSNPVVERGPGDLFGEMTCLNYYPRSATVTALEDTVVIEMLRPILLLLKRSKRFGPYLEDLYRDRSLEAMLNDPLFANVRPLIEELRPKLQLQRFKPGEVIFEQGAVADAFYLVQVGFVKVTRKLPGGELVLAYRGRGEFFGEIALLKGGNRTATCSAADHVDVVRIGVEEFRTLLERDPTIATLVHQAAEDRERSYEIDPFVQAKGVHVEELLRQDLMEAQSLLLLDLDRCTRCDLCVQACASAHGGATRLVREGLRYENYLVATSCRQCRDPKCMFGCPVGSIRRTKSLDIKIESWCIGCGVCADNCPYGNINMHEVKDAEPGGLFGHRTAAPRLRAAACDLCHNLSPDQDPSCVVACPHGAAIRVAKPKEFFGVDEPAKRPSR